MLAATHAITGGLIAAVAANPTTAIVAAVISHPLLDLFPHWDLNTRKDTQRSTAQVIALSLADASIGFLIGWLLFGSLVDLTVLLAAMFAAQIFDWAEAPYKVFNWRFPPFSTVKKFQHHCHTKLEWPWGFLPQIAILLFAVYIASTLS